MKKFIHVQEHISLNCKKWTCKVRKALFSPALEDYTAILNYENCVSMRFLLVFLMLLFLMDLICQVVFFRFIEFGYCIYMLMGIGFMALIYYAFIRETGNAFPRKPAIEDESAAGNSAIRQTHLPTIILYIFEILILLFTAFLQTALNPGDMPIIFLILLIILPMLIFDQIWRVYLMILFVSAVYLISARLILSSEAYGPILIYVLMDDVISLTWSGIIIYSRTVSLQTNGITETYASHDGLTGILNRRGGDALITNCITNGVPGAFIIFDIDNFKHINDTYGHQRGDEILKAVASCLSSSFRKEDIVTRLGGDEFLVYAIRMVDRKFVESKLADVENNLHTIAIDAQNGDHVTASIGCSINDGTYIDYSALFRTADHMLYNVKQNGKDSFAVKDASFRNQP
ncbi:diguanylate cyclase [Bilifractor sp. LCP21S3_A7]|uniref:GGDEF domain-containing protein n=1 Tax=Bilifractor sp. LCP21S3_A7 TaxID=3438738 RepID=UPI003F92F1C8